MMSALSASAPRSVDAPLSLAELGGAILAGLVPMPAESSGYLLLGIADQLAKAPVPLDPRAVLLSSEGNLSLLTLTTTSRSASEEEGLLERQLRKLLGRLLAHAPGQAPALIAVSRRSPQGGILSLIRELEAALIPVNRAAGRRALARLQREVEGIRRRIPSLLTLETHQPFSPNPSTLSAPREPAPKPPALKTTASAPVQAAPIPSLFPPQASASSLAAPIPSLFPPQTISSPSPERTEPLLFSPVQPEGEDAPTELRAPVIPLEQSIFPQQINLDTIVDHPQLYSYKPSTVVYDTPAKHATVADFTPIGTANPATVEQLLSEFAPSDGLNEREVNRMLKQATGIELSALPPGVETFLPPLVQELPPWQPAPEVIHIQAPSPAPLEPRPPRNPRASLAITFLLLLLGLAATLAIWIWAPSFFSGHGPRG